LLPPGAHLLHSLFSGGKVHVIDDNARSFFDKEERDGATDPRSGSGDQGDFILQLHLPHLVGLRAISPWQAANESYQIE
jgi:hypothetical protein